MNCDDVDEGLMIPVHSIRSADPSRHRLAPFASFRGPPEWGSLYRGESKAGRMLSQLSASASFRSGVQEFGLMCLPACVTGKVFPFIFLDTDTDSMARK